jgi:hypothetical protein
LTETAKPVQLVIVPISTLQREFIEKHRLPAHPWLMKWILLCLALGGLALAGCDKQAPPPAAPVSGQAFEPSHAQGRLPTIRLWLGAAEVTAEMALDQEAEQTGMMFRTNLEEEAGMIFVFPQPVQASFWMKNCTVPLSAGYIGADGAILEIHDLQPQDTNSVIAESADVQYVLEVNQGWFTRHHVSVGTFIRTEKGTLLETFFRKAASP